MKDTNLEKYIQECAQYIKDRRKQDREFGKTAADYKIIKRKLDSARRHLTAMFDELHSIEIQMEVQGRWPAYWEVNQYVRKACVAAGGACGPLADAQVVIRNDPATRAMLEQKTAINQAHAFLEPPGKPNRRGTRDLARRIMDAAGIEHPSDKSMSNWLKEIRADWDDSERRLAEMLNIERNGK